MSKISDVGADMIANMSDEEFSRDRSAENPNVGMGKISDEFRSQPAGVRVTGRADLLVQLARIIARNVDEERFYDAPGFQRAADEILSALEPQQEEAPQCCMCGKKGLSTIEGDGGTECQLEDGRWTCSEPCFEKAGGYGPEYAGPAALEPQQEEAEKPRHIGMIAHIDHGKTSLTAAVTRILAHPTPAQKVQESQTVSEEMVERALAATGSPLGSNWFDRDQMRAALTAAMSCGSEAMVDRLQNPPTAARYTDGLPS